MCVCPYYLSLSLPMMYLVCIICCYLLLKNNYMHLSPCKRGHKSGKALHLCWDLQITIHVIYIHMLIVNTCCMQHCSTVDIIYNYYAAPAASAVTLMQADESSIAVLLLLWSCMLPVPSDLLWLKMLPSRSNLLRKYCMARWKLFLL